MQKKYGNIFSTALIVILISVGTTDAQDKLERSAAIAGKKLAIVISYREFEDTEFRIPVKILKDERASITIASSRVGFAKGMYGLEVMTDLLIEQLGVANFDAVIFVGGLGVRSEYWENTIAHNIAKETLREDKVLAAICWAPVILANAGVLRGKRATGNTYGNAHEILQSEGAQYTGEKVTVDGKVITAFGPESAEAFALAIVRALK